jgi:hypothetical protein
MTARQHIRALWWRFADACGDNVRDLAEIVMAGAVVLCALTAFGLFLWSYA